MWGLLAIEGALHSSPEEQGSEAKPIGGEDQVVFLYGSFGSRLDGRAELCEGQSQYGSVGLIMYKNNNGFVHGVSGGSPNHMLL